MKKVSEDEEASIGGPVWLSVVAIARQDEFYIKERRPWDEGIKANDTWVRNAVLKSKATVPD